MLRSRKNVGRFKTNCYFGCCPECADKKQEKRLIKRKENIQWKKEYERNDH